MAAAAAVTGNGRPVASFSPSLWGDQFLHYIPHHHSQEKKQYSKAVEDLKNEVMGMLLMETNTVEETMDLINLLERLGLAYHFEFQIESKLHHLFTNYQQNDPAYDLCTVGLYFRLFRQHGYQLSSDVFTKFMDSSNGKFREELKSDVSGLLSLYEAAHLRVHGEDILKEALVFATTNLNSLVAHLSSPLKEEVMHALVQPLHLGCPRIEARSFISIYDKYEPRNEILLKFAKLDYNLLQLLHKEELHEITRWWKQLDLPSKLPYARDRVVECFFWALGVYHEPQYSRARVFLTKAISMTSVIDDTYDAHGTIEELNVITDAIEKWDVSEISRLPEYFKPFYVALLELYEQYEEELATYGTPYGIYYAKEKLKELVRSYHVEAKWFIKGYMPQFQQYLDNALISCTYYYHTTASLFGTKSATVEQFEWLSTKPKVLNASSTICRIMDDVTTYEVEKERGQIVTGIECYMKENGITKKESEDKLFEIATNGWKDMNEEFLKASNYSWEVMIRILNFTRIIDVVYKNNQDGYTKPEKVLKPHIIAMLIDPIKV